MNTLHIFDSVKKEKVEFKPIQEGKVKIYVCGPTVYDDSHLGHARSAIAFDLLHRVLKVNDYEVTMTKNFTDIDDKIIKKMYETNKTLENITNQYINAYKADMKALNILDNTIEPKATENLEVMKEMISNLISKDVAYKTSDSVYFDTSKDNLYGTLSHKSNDENSQARVEENQEKRNSADFALWKFEKANDVSFDAPFGKGRPGWHIECSAMIEKHLAYKDSPYQIDIHAGGADLLFPHHENEAAQTRCSSGQNLAKYWMHNGFVNINGEKMSKSLGNSFFLKDVLKSYSGEVIRFYLMSTHYRADLSFNEEDLIASKKRLDKIYRLKKRVYGIEDSSVNKKFKEDILNALNDDINTSIALSVIDEMINSANDKLDSNPKDKNLKKELISNINFIEEVLGIGGNDAYAYFQFGINESTKEKIESLILKRNEAKKTKDFQTADKLRDELSSMDISLMDTVNGTVWEKL
ncbi:cysteinyl-tRNA synthetase [Aliarcobacter butzleri RM4018]|uniref:Cysteine--tRNA ligase n=1 Tax=Aliarcobacter butzleri (strain RM4018) TaxID=367737 RepID=SYC_ALIB4|nr:cysteine--tRNA ligase [Aliarcobacter butzleri]A8ERE6.1 RecName: Full=Cysteine--tRNA ligase; AltName: Full=Cysteinyl-tRNA synthetase; Short=CysRS [Aliarcobacter butzleri RM4018]ABV66520.1 cysteinyl-tRNA synthetase [Aliarcobacter butzleri RM4018]GGT71105.1 cysteine--tRNA ligase [Aliarcobacter butzleri]SNV23772.1 Cysteine--tRNA ligase [Aliarcobacter butzleri]